MEPYSAVIAHIRTRLCFALLCSLCACMERGVSSHLLLFLLLSLLGRRLVSAVDCLVYTAIILFILASFWPFLFYRLVFTATSLSYYMYMSFLACYHRQCAFLSWKFCDYLFLFTLFRYLTFLKIENTPVIYCIFMPTDLRANTVWQFCFSLMGSLNVAVCVLDNDFSMVWLVVGCGVTWRSACY